MNEKGMIFLMFALCIMLWGQNAFGLGVNDQIEAETYNYAEGVQRENNDSTVGWFDEGDFIKYDSIDMTNAVALDMMVAGMTEGGAMELRIDSQWGQVIGTYYMQATGGWNDFQYRRFTFSSITSGVHDLFLVGKSGQGILNIDSFTLRWERRIDDLIEAETYNEASGVQRENNDSTVGWFDEGDFIEYYGMDLTNVTSVDMNVAGMTDGGAMELRIDSQWGEVIGTYWMESTSGWNDFQHRNVQLSNTVSGVHDLYLVGKSGQGILNIDSFTLRGGSPPETKGIDDLIQAEHYQDSYGVQVAGDSVGWFDEGDYMKYSSLNFDNVGAFEMKIAGTNNGGEIELRVDDRWGQVIGTYKMQSTGAWDAWRPCKFILSNPVSGVHDLYIVGKSGQGILNIDSFALKWQNQSGIDAYPGYTGNYPGYTLQIDDRFDYYDSSLWAKGDGTFQECYVRYRDDNVVFNGDGKMRLRIKKEHVPGSWSWCELDDVGDRDYTGGELRTHLKYRYGRIEVRLKSPTLSGYIQSLFTFNYPKKPVWDEIDWELQGQHPDYGSTNLIIGKDCGDWESTRQFGAYEQNVDIPNGGTTHDWHVYAIEWTPWFIKWFIDGQEVRVLNDWETWYNNAPQQGWIPGDGSPTADGQGQGSEIMMNFWLPNPQIMYDFGGEWSPAVFDNGNFVDAEYDWFRYYRMD